MRYVNYHKHTHYSNISTPDCIVKPIDYVNRAKELGHQTLVTTEHGYAGNVFEYYTLAKQNDLKLIFGIEYYYVNNRHAKDKSNTHLMIVAKNKNGMKQMNRILSESNRTGFYYKNRVDKELVLSLNPNDVIVTSTCAMSYVGRHDDYEESFIEPFLKHFGENFFLEIQPHTHEIQVEYNKKILDLHNKYGIPLIHANDSHYIYPEQKTERDLFLRGKNIWYPEEEGFILDYPDIDTILERYEQQGVFTREQAESAIKQTLIMENFDDIEMDNHTIKMPTLYPELTPQQRVEKLKEIIKEKWNEERKNLPKEMYPKYKEAIQEEMKVIEETNDVVHTADYFLLNHEIVKRAIEKGGVLTDTGRGSAPSFYLNKLLGFTKIDRINAPIPLYSSRFMSKSRLLETRSLPDIDFNTANPEVFLEATKEILGEDHAYYMIAYGTMKISEAFRCMCRAKGIPMDEYNDIAKPLGNKHTKDAQYEKLLNDPRWSDILKDAERLFVGVIHQASPHPCAVLVYDKSISEELGLMYVTSKDDTGDNENKKTKKEGRLCALIDSTTADKWKYLKDDFLKVEVVEIIHEVFKEIGEERPDMNELIRITEGDEKVWRLYEKGLTATLNQTGTDSAIPQVMRYKPKNIAELSAFVAAIRPAFESIKDKFLNREPYSYGIPEFDELLKGSNGFCLYQENIMSALIFAGLPSDEAYGILKMIAKKDPKLKEKQEELKKRFVEGFVAKTGSKENALKVFKIIEDSGDYGFNSSHSLSVALDSLYGAYLKANYPLQYMTYVLNLYEEDTDKTAQIFKELPYFGIKVEPVEFGKSSAKYSYDLKTNKIYKGLKSIKYLNEQVANELQEVANKVSPHDDFVDVLRVIKEETSCNSRQLKILIGLNFFKRYGGNAYLMKVYDQFEKRFKKTHKEATKIKRIEEIRDFSKSLNKNEAMPPYDQIQFEKEYLGYISSTYAVPKKYGLVLDVNARSGNVKISILQLATGNEKMFKMFKNDYWAIPQEELFKTGDIIEINKFVQRDGWIQKNGKWVQTSAKKDTFITSWTMIGNDLQIVS